MHHEIWFQEPTRGSTKLLKFDEKFPRGLIPLGKRFSLLLRALLPVTKNDKDYCSKAHAVVTFNIYSATQKA